MGLHFSPFSRCASSWLHRKVGAARIRLASGIGSWVKYICQGSDEQDALSALLTKVSMAQRQTNRPHYHIWKKARTGRIFYRIATPYTHRQSAQRAVKKA